MVLDMEESGQKQGVKRSKYRAYMQFATTMWILLQILILIVKVIVVSAVSCHILSDLLGMTAAAQTCQG